MGVSKNSDGWFIMDMHMVPFQGIEKPSIPPHNSHIFFEVGWMSLR